MLNLILFTPVIGIGFILLSRQRKMGNNGVVSMIIGGELKGRELSRVAGDSYNNSNPAITIARGRKEREITSSLNFLSISLSIISLVTIYSFILLYLFNINQLGFSFVTESSPFDLAGTFPSLFIGVDGISVYFVLLCGLILPISLMAAPNLPLNKEILYIIIFFLTYLLISVFCANNVLYFYIFFEAILIPLFLLIGIFGSSYIAGYYLFIYTLFGSLFLLLSIIGIINITGVADYDSLFKVNLGNLSYLVHIFIFLGIMFAFAIKTPVFFLHIWLLKAHVESPLPGSIILAGIVLKLSLYGVFRLVLPLLEVGYINFTFLVYLICVITIFYGGLTTLMVIDIKEIIAYSSVSHAAVYLLGGFSNSLIGIEGSVVLGIAHGLVSSALFICVGGVLYDRVGSRLIFYYKGLAQSIPLFALLFTFLSLANCGVPLSLNFVGEFMSLYGTFERLPIAGFAAAFSTVISAAYSLFLLNRILFGRFSLHLESLGIFDLSKREFSMLFVLLILTLILGIFPNIILDGLHLPVSELILGG